MVGMKKKKIVISVTFVVDRAGPVYRYDLVTPAWFFFPTTLHTGIMYDASVISSDLLSTYWKGLVQRGCSEFLVEEYINFKQMQITWLVS